MFGTGEYLDSPDTDVLTFHCFLQCNKTLLITKTKEYSLCIGINVASEAPEREKSSTLLEFYVLNEIRLIILKNFMALLKKDVGKTYRV